MPAKPGAMAKGGAGGSITPMGGYPATPQQQQGMNPKIPQGPRFSDVMRGRGVSPFGAQGGTGHDNRWPRRQTGGSPDPPRPPIVIHNGHAAQQSRKGSPFGAQGGTGHDNRWPRRQTGGSPDPPRPPIVIHNGHAAQQSRKGSPFGAQAPGGGQQSMMDGGQMFPQIPTGSGPPHGPINYLPDFSRGPDNQFGATAGTSSGAAGKGGGQQGPASY